MPTNACVEFKKKKGTLQKFPAACEKYHLSDKSEALVYEWAQLTAGLLIYTISSCEKCQKDSAAALI